MLTKLLLALVLTTYGGTTHQGALTSYAPATVDSRWNGVARWTGEPPVVGVTAACPEEWRGDLVIIPPYGIRYCGDTPGNGWRKIAGKWEPHIDIFSPDVETARIIGNQEGYPIIHINVYE
jgi:hypothetical protein